MLDYHIDVHPSETQPPPTLRQQTDITTQTRVEQCDIVNRSLSIKCVTKERVPT